MVKPSSDVSELFSLGFPDQKLVRRSDNQDSIAVGDSDPCSNEKLVDLEMGIQYGQSSVEITLIFGELRSLNWSTSEDRHHQWE